MKRLLAIFFTLLLCLGASAATIKWYSDMVDTTTFISNDVIAVERAVPQGYRSVRWGTMAGAISNIVGFTNGTLTADSLIFSGTITGNGDSLTNTEGFHYADTNWVEQQISSLGIHIYDTGTTNNADVASRTNLWQGWSSYDPTTSTNELTGLTANAYIRNVVSTNTVLRIEAGPISVDSYLFKSVAGSVTIHPEVYLYDTVSNTLLEIGAGAPRAITATTPTLHQFSISVSSYTLTNANKLVWAWKVDSVTPAPTLYFVSGPEYDSHLSFVQNLASATINATQIVGAGNLIYSNAATALVNGSTNWYGTYPTNQGATIVPVGVNGPKYTGYSTNAAFEITGLSGVDAAETSVSQGVFCVTNTSGSAVAVTVPASFLISGGTTQYLTNQAILSIMVYPGLGTNAAWLCVK